MLRSGRICWMPAGDNVAARTQSEMAPAGVKSCLLNDTCHCIDSIEVRKCRNILLLSRQVSRDRFVTVRLNLHRIYIDVNPTRTLYNYSDK